MMENTRAITIPNDDTTSNTGWSPRLHGYWLAGKGRQIVRLVSHVVVDPDPIFVSEAPGLVCVVVTPYYVTLLDDDALRMEIAATLGALIETHNFRRTGVEYETSAGELRKLKPIKVSDLSICITEHRRW